MSDTNLHEAFLRNVLGSHVPLHLWGIRNAKTVVDLLREIDNRETVLLIGCNGPERLIKIVKIHVKDPGNPRRGCLIEVEQQLPDGRMRPRGQEPSGKIRHGESPARALTRELMEELGLLPENWTAENGEVVIEVNESPSYPGLPTTYEIHHFVVTPKPGSLCLQNKFSVEDPSDKSISYFEWKPNK